MYTYPNVLEVPADFFDVDAAVESHPATSEKPETAQISCLNTE